MSVQRQHINPTMYKFDVQGLHIKNTEYAVEDSLEFVPKYVQEQGKKEMASKTARVLYKNEPYKNCLLQY